MKKTLCVAFSESSSEFYQQGQQAQQQAQQQIQEESRGKLNRNLVIIVTIVIIVALGFLLPRQQQPSPPLQSSDSETSQAITSNPLDTEHSEVEIATPEITSTSGEIEKVSITNENTPPQPETVSTPIVTPSPTQEAPKPLKPVPVSTDPLRLEIEASQLTWVVVKSDNDSPKEALLQPGQLANWEAQQQFTLTLGNAAGAVVRLNGESRGPFGKPGEVVREVVLKP